MAPTKIGFIGLSASDSWASSAHLPYLKDTSKYQIVALLNSSAASARAAITAHSLPDSTKAYGDPAELAADPDVELVVLSVRVDRHFPVLRTILQQGGGNIKAIYSEWPLGSNLAEAEELAALAKGRGIRTIVGLQGRRTPVVHKVKELLDSGRIGEVLSVNVTGAAYNFGAEELESLAYLGDAKIGGNIVTIHFSHYFDAITQAVGQLSSFSSVLETKRSTVQLRDKPLHYTPKEPTDAPVKIVGSVPRTAPDQVLLQGHLKSGALISYHLRGGPEFPGTPRSVWSIYGTTGEIRVTTSSGSLHIGGPGQTLQVHDHKSGKVESLSPEAGDEFDQKELPWPARNVARIYEAFADGRENDYADWDEAVVRHRFVDELLRRQKEGGGEQPAQYLSDTYGNSLEL